VFRRTNKVEDTQSARLEQKGPGAKGRPTPTRKEAEAARRERAKSGMDKKTAKKVLRERQAESNAKVRAGMRSGDERYLPPRDKGPARKFARDWVDSRRLPSQYFLPFSLLSWTLTIALTFLEFLVICLQAYVFTVLTASYVQGALADEH